MPLRWCSLNIVTIQLATQQQNSFSRHHRGSVCCQSALTYTSHFFTWDTYRCMPKDPGFLKLILFTAFFVVVVSGKNTMVSGSRWGHCPGLCQSPSHFTAPLLLHHTEYKYHQQGGKSTKQGSSESVIANGFDLTNPLAGFRASPEPHSGNHWFRMNSTSSGLASVASAVGH